MSEYITNEPYTNAIRQQIVAIARSMLTREICFLIGSRELIALQSEAAVRLDDSDFLIFAGIASESDDFPLGEVRQYWNKKALKNLQPAIQATEVWAYEFGASACNSLISRFS